MKHLFMAIGLAVILNACNLSGGKSDSNEGENPFFTEYTTPYGIPPFEQIKLEHYKPAFIKGMEEAASDIEQIVNNTEEPTFENTIVALDQSGELLRRVSRVFSGQNSVNTNDDMQALNRELSPLLSKHSDDILLNQKLFERVKAVYDSEQNLRMVKENPNIFDKEKSKLLSETYKRFVRGGANLSETDQAKLRELNSEISMLQITFEQNVLKETNAFQLFIEKDEDLAGLPESLIANAAEAAKNAEQDGKWLFTQHNPSVMPFLQYSANRELREKMFNGYINRGNYGNAEDNKEVVRKLVSLRLDKAKLMGYNDFASFILEERMAKNAKNVDNLLNELWTPALAKAKEELADINAEIKKDGQGFTAEGWDWRYYFEKAKVAKFNLDENEIRPYLKLENVYEGAFYVANKLFGITFTPINNVPLPHPEAIAFECKDNDGSLLGIVFFDFFPRASKRGGAWCGSYRPQSYDNEGNKIIPLVTMVCNFTPPAAGEPALLSADEANTLFHEFGHGLHGLFKDVHYNGVSGVPRDFVELPSQFMEHYVFEPEVLKVYAKHYKTGEIIPDELIKKLDESGKYGQGFATVEYLAASYLDMDYHVLKNVPSDMDVMKFEEKVLANRNLLKEIPPRYRSTYFRHTMGGGYTAGYYSYIWSEVLDCDAFEAFKETGNIFDQEVAKKYRDYILTPGGIDDAMEMYINFRGKSPNTTPLLKNRGLK